MAQISEIVTQSESSGPVTMVSERIIGELSIFGEDQSSRTRLCSALGQTISPTERFMKACKSNPVQWCDRFLGEIRSECDVMVVDNIAEDIRAKTDEVILALEVNDNLSFFSFVGYDEQALQNNSAVALWWNRDLHNFGAFEMPTDFEQILLKSSKESWKFLNSLFPENFRREAVIIPSSAFKFWFQKDVYECLTSSLKRSAVDELQMIRLK